MNKKNKINKKNNYEKPQQYCRKPDNFHLK